MIPGYKSAIICALAFHFAVIMSDPITDLCQALKPRLGPDAVVQQSSPTYADVAKNYFSVQESRIRPACFVQPSSAQEVSIVISEIHSARSASKGNGRGDVQFAVKSGGHTPWSGSANIENGITIDLGKLNTVDVAPDNTTTSIGPGARWADVYGKLDAVGLSVVGGRVAHVGVGGLLLGGGISFFSPKEGFACDNVVDFEIVLADGQITHASKDQNTDLWTALKGGSNNFGIVTKFTLRSFPQGKLWGGVNLSPVDLADGLIDAFHNFTVNPDYDENANLIQSFDFYSKDGSRDISNSMHYTQPIERPKVLEPFWSATSQYSTLRTTSLLDLTTELGAFSPNGRYELYTTTTIKSDPTLLKKVAALYNATLPGLAAAQNLFWGMIFQPLPPAITGKTHKHGIDPLGLDGAPPLVNVLISAAWDRAADEALVVETARRFVRDIDDAARGMGLDDAFVYLNYALQGQDPFAGYGAKNKAFLQDVSRKYDPQGLFRTGCPGGFKVFP